MSTLCALQLRGHGPDSDAINVFCDALPDITVSWSIRGSLVAETLIRRSCRSWPNLQ
jgi:hypothetical protein